MGGGFDNYKDQVAYELRMANDGKPVDVLYAMDKDINEIAWEGDVELVYNDWISKHMEQFKDPTYKEILLWINKCMEINGAGDHVYFEGIRKDTSDGMVEYSVIMGS